MAPCCWVRVGGFFVYVLRCADGSLYTGWTNDLLCRFAEHTSGRGARYTRSRLPCRLLAWWETESRSAAMREEARFKCLSRTKKLEALTRGEVFGRVVRNGEPHGDDTRGSDGHRTR
jgi:putative endonuclease